MADRFGDWVNEDQWDVDDEDEDDDGFGRVSCDETDEYGEYGYDEDDDPLDPMRFDPWRGYAVVPGEYADDEAPEDDGGYLIPWSAYAVEMTDHWRRCPACGVVERSPAGVGFFRDDCEECNPIPF